MASENGIMGRDPCWKYCTPMEGNKNGTICNYCGLAIKSGGITHFNFTYHIQTLIQIQKSVLTCLQK
ncbi:hypothetical protein VitviT2T_002686 [Vitis vinifera]|uniref:BED-type domain-containing protein n=1 Tax=Vitis vinifera TaxID=29760 RepID=A0ABY9BJ90_VITVI|nr:hypothetical protein VitviT2T_002686 [Vitis vinifera]